MCCAIWYHLYNLKTVKNTHGGVLLLVTLNLKHTRLKTAILLKVTLLHGCFSRFFNCTNCTKPQSQLSKSQLSIVLYCQYFLVILFNIFCIKIFFVAAVLSKYAGNVSFNFFITNSFAMAPRHDRISYGKDHPLSTCANFRKTNISYPWHLYVSSGKKG